MSYDYLLIGGGLQNGLLALALRHHRPSATLAIVERSPRLGGNHTWSFHALDVPAAAAPWVEPLVQHRWPGYEVSFPRHARTVHEPYASFTGERLDAVVRARLAAAPGCALVLDAEVTRVDARGASLADGRRFDARLVIDARGPGPAASAARGGYQKFVGQEILLASPHGLSRPVLMDARVAQIDGFRFVYALPLTPDSLLVEDTYFSDTPALDAPALRARIAEWTAARGLRVASILREEEGVLAMPGEMPVEAARDPASHVIAAGFAGGWFHPATGYSMPLAVRLASFVATRAPEEARGPAFAELLAARNRAQRFPLLLNRLLFEATPIDVRRDVMERFYRLPPDVISRFYAMQLRPTDPVRVLLSPPPRGVSLTRALGALGDALRPRAPANRSR